MYEMTLICTKMNLLAETVSKYEWLRTTERQKPSRDIPIQESIVNMLIFFKLCFPKIPLNLLDEFNNPSKLADEISPVLSAR